MVIFHIHDPPPSSIGFALLIPDARGESVSSQLRANSNTKEANTRSVKKQNRVN